MTKNRPFRFAAWLLMLFVPLWVQASGVVRASVNNDSWNRAENLGRNPSAVVLYGRLSGTSDARYYFFSVTHPASLQLKVELAEEAARVEPRVVLYSPEDFTIGPALPMPQPAKTLALIYPANAEEIHVEGPLRTTMATRVDQTMELPQAGRYFLAVYNAGKDSGAYRLTLSSEESSEWPLSTRLRSWWLGNIWLGPQYGALTIPLAIALAALIVWLIIRRIPHPVPVRHRGRRTKRTVVRGRLS